MALRTEHEIHRRRRSRNVGLGIVLLGFVALVFGLTVVKVQEGGLVEVLEGIDPGTQIIVSNLHRVQPGTPVAATLRAERTAKAAPVTGADG